MRAVRAVTGAIGGLWYGKTASTTEQPASKDDASTASPPRPTSAAIDAAPNPNHKPSSQNRSGSVPNAGTPIAKARLLGGSTTTTGSRRRSRSTSRTRTPRPMPPSSPPNRIDVGGPPAQISPNHASVNTGAAIGAVSPVPSPVSPDSNDGKVTSPTTVSPNGKESSPNTTPTLGRTLSAVSGVVSSAVHAVYSTTTHVVTTTVASTAAKIGLVWTGSEPKLQLRDSKYDLKRTGKDKKVSEGELKDALEIVKGLHHDLLQVKQAVKKAHDELENLGKDSSFPEMLIKRYQSSDNAAINTIHQQIFQTFLQKKDYDGNQNIKRLGVKDLKIIDSQKKALQISQKSLNSCVTKTTTVLDQKNLGFRDHKHIYSDVTLDIASRNDRIRAEITTAGEFIKLANEVVRSFKSKQADLESEIQREYDVKLGTITVPDEKVVREACANLNEGVLALNQNVANFNNGSVQRNEEDTAASNSRSLATRLGTVDRCARRLELINDNIVNDEKTKKYGESAFRALEKEYGLANQAKKEMDKKVKEFQALKAKLAKPITDSRNAAAEAKNGYADLYSPVIDMIRKSILDSLAFWHGEVNCGGGVVAKDAKGDNYSAMVDGYQLNEIRVPTGIGEMIKALHDEKLNSQEKLHTIIKAAEDRLAKCCCYSFFVRNDETTSTFYRAIKGLKLGQRLSIGTEARSQFNDKLGRIKNKSKQGLTLTPPGQQPLPANRTYGSMGSTPPR